ncbi:M81 family metallopeptidase [Terrarubrum flagellatum]|uniref:M81 family metallopeptidase n=1 Tax=Terrirubrum flagellatum TaxID=2895980 RepID=UPI003144E84C
MRLFAASIATETNTFSPIPTGYSNFRDSFAAGPGEHPDEPRLCTAPLYVARRRAKEEGFTLIEGSCFWAEPSGSVVRRDYEMMRDRILAELKAAMPVDSVLMGFHGAMAAEGYDDVEGDMLERIRAIVGPDVIIGCEYDPHCHLTEKRVRLQTVGVLFKEYPHVDFLERGEEVVDIVLRTLRGQIKPVVSLYDPRMYDFYPTTTEPMRSFVDRIKAMEGKNGILSVSIGHGFSHADVPEMGSRVLVYTDGRKADGDRLAKELADELVAKRGQWCPPTLEFDDALQQALSLNAGTAIIAEPSDNAGGGATSDNTFSLRALREKGVTNVAIAPMWDPVSVQFCFAAGVGAKIPLRIGGKASAGSGDPVDAQAEVIALCEDTWQHFGAAKVPLGDTACVRLDGVDVILISKRTQALGDELFTHLGLDPGAYRLLMLKSAQHFAGGFGKYARLILRGETGGCCPQDPNRHPYTRVNRPLWPLDPLPEGRLLI